MIIEFLQSQPKQVFAHPFADDMPKNLLKKYNKRSSWNVAFAFRKTQKSDNAALKSISAQVDAMRG